MGPLSLSVVLAAALASPIVHGTEAASSPAKPESAAIPALHTPSAITSSGYAFIARCDDQAFARTRYPQNLAERCERLLKRWRWEANVLARRPAEGPRIPNYADALRSSAMAGMPMGNSL